MAKQKQMLVSEAARRAGYSTKRVDQLARAGVIKPQLVAGLRVYSDADVDALLAHRAEVEARRPTRSASVERG